jgi:hypothetical protein
MEQLNLGQSAQAKVAFSCAQRARCFFFIEASGSKSRGCSTGKSDGAGAHGRIATDHRRGE